MVVQSPGWAMKQNRIGLHKPDGTIGSASVVPMKSKPCVTGSVLLDGEPYGRRQHFQDHYSL